MAIFSRRKKRPMTRGGFQIFLGIGILILLASVFFFIKSLLFVMSAEKTMGTVTSVEKLDTTCTRKEKTGKRSSRTVSYPCTKYTARISFGTKDNRPYNFSESAGSHKRPCSDCRADYATGQKLEVIYDPSNPGHASLNTFGALYGGPTIAGVLGLFMFCFGAFPLTKGEFNEHGELDSWTGS